MGILLNGNMWSNIIDRDFTLFLSCRTCGFDHARGYQGLSGHIMQLYFDICCTVQT